MFSIRRFGANGAHKIATPEARRDHLLRPTRSPAAESALIDSDLLLQHVPQVSILCVDLVALKRLSGLLQADDTLAVLAFLVSAIDASVVANKGQRLHLVGAMYFAVFGEGIGVRVNGGACLCACVDPQIEGSFAALVKARVKGPTIAPFLMQDFPRCHR